MFGSDARRGNPTRIRVNRVFGTRYRIIETDPLSAQAEIKQRALLRRDGWEIRVTCATRVSATAEAFQFSGDLEAYDGDEKVAHRQWAVVIPRIGL